jgi:hypothetical protein
MFAGAFSPARPRRYPSNSAIDPTPTAAPAHVVGMLNSLDGVVTEVMEEGKGDEHCGGEVELEGDYGNAGTQLSRTLSTYAHAVNQQAARGCVPADFAYIAGQEDEGDRYIALFVRGDPRAFGSLLLGSETANAAFEKRAAARGFQPIIVRDTYELWGKTATPHRIDRHVPLTVLLEHVRAGFERGAILTSLSYSRSSALSSTTATIVWTEK